MSARSGDRLAALDLGTTLAIAFAACFLSQRLPIMTALVPLIMALRMVAYARLPEAERPLPARAELALYLGCSLLGGFNDWNTVVRKGVYAYTVPTDLPGISTIPIWMLLFWGPILRLVLTLASWSRVGAGELLGDAVHLPGRRLESAPLRILLLLGLVLCTRLAIYRLYLDPVLSFLPFALAIALHALLFRPGPGARFLALLFLTCGGAVEALLIQLGRLHHYELGWLAGVPLWIVLWWALAVLIWGELGSRLVRVLQRRFAA